MDNLLSNILSFFTDKTRSIGSKSLFFLAILFCFFLFDYFTGLSFYIGTNYKLNQIEKIERIKKENPDNIWLHHKLNRIENEIIIKKSINDYFSFFEFSDLNFVESDSVATPDTLIVSDSLMVKIDTIRTNEIGDLKNKPDELGGTRSRSNLIHILTSSYSFVFLLLLMPFIFFSERRLTRNLIVGAVFGTIMLLGLIWFFSYLFSLIPLLTYPWINYFVNFALHTLFLTLMGLIAKKKNSMNG